MFLKKQTNSYFELIIKISGINGIILVKDSNMRLSNNIIFYKKIF